MSDELDMVISADITIARYSDAVYGDIFRKEEPERFQFSAVGDEEIRRIVQEAANNAFPDRRECLTITYHLENDNTKRPEKQYVYHLFPTANERGRKIPVEKSVSTRSTIATTASSKTWILCSVFSSANTRR